MAAGLSVPNLVAAAPARAALVVEVMVRRSRAVAYMAQGAAAGAYRQRAGGVGVFLPVVAADQTRGALSAEHLTPFSLRCRRTCASRRASRETIAPSSCRSRSTADRTLALQRCVPTCGRSATAGNSASGVASPVQRTPHAEDFKQLVHALCDVPLVLTHQDGAQLGELGRRVLERVQDVCPSTCVTSSTTSAAA
jgi:hypothetical protein